ncbi:MerR family transcriptional regulator [Marinospirillum celere]|nr:MerR family transcriptional regulator [Marinospirillum celere]
MTLAEEQGASPLYPIREVSRLTGVNTVTLRAWERRYGLICPQRTPKGHRLYSGEDIDTIRKVLQWLDKGVAVSQVGDLLDQPLQTSMETSVEGDWADLHSQLIRCLEQQDEEQLDQLYCQLLSSWSGSQLNQELLIPLAKQLAPTSAAAALLARYLRTRLGERFYHRRTSLAGSRILLLPLSQTPTPDWNLLGALLALVDLDFKVSWLDTVVDQKAILQLLNLHKPRLLLVTNPEAAETTWLQKSCCEKNLPLAQIGGSTSDQLPCLEKPDSHQLHLLIQGKQVDES